MEKIQLEKWQYENLKNEIRIQLDHIKAGHTTFEEADDYIIDRFKHWEKQKQGF